MIPQVFGLDLRYRGGRFVAAPPASLLTAEGRPTARPVADLAAYEPLLFVLHGFNVSRTDGIGQLSRFATAISATGLEFGAIVWVTWPGDGPGGPMSYPLQEPDADDTAHHLARALSEAVRPRQPVHFAAHSLGCRVVFETVKQLLGSAVRVGTVVTMAAAVDGSSPSESRRYRAAVASVDRVLVLRSEDDRVLRWAFPVGDLVASLFYGGSTCAALGFRGPAPSVEGGAPGNIDVARHRGADHSDYLPPPTGSPTPLQSAAVKLVADYLRAGT